MKLISIASLLLVVVVAATVVDAQHNTGDGGVKWLPNCDYFGGDIDRNRVPVEECGRACIDNPGCNHFTYVNGNCLLKRHDQSFRRKPCSACDLCGFIPWRS
uniref:Apple domain-containing protein n=1 Tax=Daphnia galeata TaxID=27404 RepID=A0A8J2WC82_9CRUS|nr:unnamed protein product [Daphnia galeata]